MADDLEPTTQKIADRGRDALLERLRPAFSEAAKAHADVLPFSDEQLEQMVQRAADRADGLQWRRALAEVATEELGVSLGEALGHPAVARAQEIVGAPSYDDALAAISASEAVQRESAVAAPYEPAIAARPAIAAEPEAVEPEAVELETVALEPALVAPAEPEPAPAPAAFSEPEPTRAALAELEPEQPAADPEPIRVAAVHLGGVASLAAGASDIELFLSQHGLDIIRGADEILGRLTWDEIRALDVPSARSLRRRRRDQQTSLVVRTGHGEAAFAIPAVAPDELRAHMEPLVRRYSRLGAGR